MPAGSGVSSPNDLDMREPWCCIESLSTSDKDRGVQRKKVHMDWSHSMHSRNAWSERCHALSHGFLACSCNARIL